MKPAVYSYEGSAAKPARIPDKSSASWRMSSLTWIKTNVSRYAPSSAKTPAPAALKKALKSARYLEAEVIMAVGGVGGKVFTSRYSEVLDQVIENWGEANHFDMIDFFKSGEHPGRFDRVSVSTPSGVIAGVITHEEEAKWFELAKEYADEAGWRKKEPVSFDPGASLTTAEDDSDGVSTKRGADQERVVIVSAVKPVEQSLDDVALVELPMYGAW